MSTTSLPDRATIGSRARAVALQRYSLESALSRFDALFAEMALPGASIVAGP
jgi:hypothetical protein